MSVNSPTARDDSADPSSIAPRDNDVSVEGELATLRSLLQSGRHGEALARAEALLAEYSRQRDLLYFVAVAQRYLGRIPDALATLERLEALYPGFSRLYQERGHCYVALREARPAIDAFLKAVNINPALPASWNALRMLYEMTGEADNARTAAAHVDKLGKLPGAVVVATALLSDGDLDQAERLIRDFLLQHGDEIEAMRLLARIGMRREVYDDAETLLDAVLRMAPSYRAARYDYALVLMERHKHAAALTELDKLLALDSQNRSYRISYATACVGLGRHERGIEIYRQVLAETPAAADLHLSIAHGLKTVGRQSEAIAEYRRAIEIRPNYGEAYWSLANLKTYRFDDEDIRCMCEQLQAPRLAPEDEFHFYFALGKALEDRADYAESFRHYERGNALKKAQIRFRIETIERNAELQMRHCTREFFEARGDFGCAGDDPIFIVGLPRAGSTLIEQILASHSKVEGTMELPNVLWIVGELQGRETVQSAGEPRYPAVLADLDADSARRLGERYLADTQVYRSGKPRFIDKMPNNFRHLGLIHLILPNARIIDARREPMACCFSNFKQLFANGQEFTYSIDDLARYYRSYVALMDHWERAFPGRILRIQHEQLVHDLEGNVRRLLEFCGLEFEPACLEFHKTTRSVRTASSEQVRRPIFKEGLEQWRHFEPWLEPLRRALGPTVADSV